MSSQHTKPAQAPVDLLKEHAKLMTDQLKSALTALQKQPGQEKNAACMLQALKGGHLPNGEKPVLWAIDGKVGLGKFSKYSEELAASRKKNPNVKSFKYSYNSQMMAGGNPTPPPAAPNQQLAQYAWCDRAPRAMYGHDLTIEIRASPDDGGNPNLIRRRQVLNDTGSNVQTVWVEDWNALRVPGMVSQTNMITSATGWGRIQNVELEIRIMKRVLGHDAQGNVVEQCRPLTYWFRENCVLKDRPNTLLSGETMRQFLYFATQPGNDRLLVSQKKQAIIDGLEARLATDNPN